MDKTRIPQFPFEFSVVMAVYNVAPFLRQSVDSLISQDFGFENIQLILVDDGSTDGSSEICDAYAQRFSNIVVIHKQNEGVASARNEGLRYATGHYINFMDSDDYFTDNAFRLVHGFFKAHEDWIDVVTIPLQFFDAQHGNHWQNGKFKQGTRVIDLYLDYQATLMFVNASFFHSRMKRLFWFDKHLVCGEDMKMILTVLAEKMKLGVVTGCKYMYRRRSVGEASLIQSAKQKRGWYFDYFTYLIDWAVAFYKEKFGYLPAFVQYQLLCDLQWRYKEEYDMTEVLSPAEIQEYKERAAASLRYFDDKYILEQKMIWNEHKCYMLSQKYGALPALTPRANDVIVHFGNTILSSFSNQYSLIEFMDLQNDKLTIEGYTKLSGIDLDAPVEICLQANEALFPCQILPRSSINEYRFSDLMFRGIQFKGCIPLRDMPDGGEIRLVVQYKGNCIPKKSIRFGHHAPVGHELKNAYYYQDGWAVQVNGNALNVFPCSKKKHVCLEGKLFRELWRKPSLGAKKSALTRILYSVYRKCAPKKIWLISDRPTAAGDNGETFFRFLAKKEKTDIKPLFVIKKDSPDYKRMKQYGHVVAYLSKRHKFYHLVADKLISSQADTPVYNPFFQHFSQYRDILSQKDFVFLQHGVTKDDASRWFSRYKVNLKGFVCSALPEQESLLDENYGYSSQEIWLTGLPRFDNLYHDEKRKILLMPSWRAYLVTNDSKTGVRTAKDSFEKSAYFEIYSKLLTDERIHEAARKYHYTIHYVSHPNMRDTIRKLPKSSFVTYEENPAYNKLFAEGNLLVTDYSSVAFDFAYLRKPVMYCQADHQAFFSGNHTLSKGYFDYERDGFGEVEYTAEATIARIIEYMENGCQLKPMYRQRIDKFFAFQDHGSCQRVYEKIMELNAKRG